MNNPDNPRYVSLEKDGTPHRLFKNKWGTYCEWCGEPIKPGRLTIRRRYLKNGVFHDSNQHLSCYERTYQYCLEHGHTFDEYIMDPHPAIKSNPAIK